MEYPARESSKGGWGAFGYDSAMIHLAVMRDDPEGFMRFLEGAGGVNCDTFLASSVVSYAAGHGAVKCVEALYSSGMKDDFRTKKEWIKYASNDPPYGPGSGRPKG